MINYMYTDNEIKKAGTDAGFSTHEVDTLFYQLIENKKLEPQQLLQQTPCTAQVCQCSNPDLFKQVNGITVCLQCGKD